LIKACHEAEFDRIVAAPNTMGMVEVAAFAASAEALSVATRIATCRRTSSVASPDS
jgi:hypothetical protein